MGTLLDTILIYYGGHLLYNGISNNCLISQNSFRFGYGMCGRYPSKLCTQKPVEVDCCKSWSLCMADHIISTAE